MFKISFNFDENTETITNISVIKSDTHHVLIESNKIHLSAEAISLMQLKPGDKVSVNYIQKNNEITIPLIGKASAFGDANEGNKLTKLNTVSFRGNQYKMLLEYGDSFVITEYPDKPGAFQMSAPKTNEIPDIQEDVFDLPKIDDTEINFF